MPCFTVLCHPPFPGQQSPSTRCQANRVVSFNISIFIVSDQCAQQDPPIGNLDKLMNLACDSYEYGRLFAQILKNA